MPRAVVTGGAGLVGSHLCDRLLAEGWEVVCLDSLLTGRIENLAAALKNSRFRFEDLDITNYLDVDGPVDFVLHFASPASPRDYLQHPIHTLKVGAVGTLHSLGLAKAKGATFLLASTSEVYGDPAVSPQPETYWGNVNPVGPRGVYDEAKRYGEALAMAYHAVHGFPAKIPRSFNTGPVASAVIRSDLPSQPGESRGGHGQPARGTHPTTVGELLGDRACREAHRRSVGTLPRHFLGPQGTGLGAEGSTGGGAGEDHRLGYRSGVGMGSFEVPSRTQTTAL